MRQIVKLTVPAVATSLLLAACGSGSSNSTSSSSAAAQPAASTGNAASTAIIKTASNPTLGGTILVDAQGMTLYHLSAEQNGKFICTGAQCLQAWHPLAVAAATKPTSNLGSLGAIKRPDATQQVTFRGMPLYTFAQDQKPGDAKGQGLKDVGTWSAVRTSTSASTTSPAPAKAPTPAPAQPSNGY